MGMRVAITPLAYAWDFYPGQQKWTGSAENRLLRALIHSPIEHSSLRPSARDCFIETLASEEEDMPEAKVAALSSVLSSVHHRIALDGVTPSPWRRGFASLHQAPTTRLRC
jgi:hypothetical protein